MVPNSEHIKLLRGRLSQFQQWRADNPDECLDLTEINPASFDRGILRNKNLLGPANLKDSDLSGFPLQDTDFARCDLSGVNFKEAEVNRVSFKDAENVYKAIELDNVCVNEHTTRKDNVAPDVNYFHTIWLPWQERLCGWEKLRGFGKLPLFNASYVTIAAIVIFLYFHEAYNASIETIRLSAGEIASDETHTWQSAASIVTSKLLTLKLSWLIIITLLSAVSLAFASTIFEIWCPDRVKAFSREEWCNQNLKPLIHYWPQCWWRRKRRLACGFFYIFGAILAVIILVVKIGQAFVYIGHAIANGTI